jgi:riboflavin synthase
MFTGIVEKIGTIKQIQRQSQGAMLTIEAADILTDAKVGDSIAVDGACLTMTRIDSERFTADVSAETLRRTTLGERKTGDGVNLERPLRLSDRLGGHLVLGHVDDVGIISGWQDEGESSLMRVSASAEVMRYVVYKGSICVDGISLTISKLFDDGFEIALIPHTKTVTTLGAKRIGGRVNIEVDLLGRYIERLLTNQTGKSGGIDLDFLREHGYLNH